MENNNKQLVNASKIQSVAVQNFVGKKTSDIYSILEKYKLQILNVLPKYITPERMFQMITYMVSKNPKLAECSMESIIGGMMQAAILNFQPSDALGQCYFVPYNTKVGNTWIKEAQFQIGYKGYTDLSRRSKSLRMIYAECVFKEDVFEYEIGLNPKLKHVPNLDIVRTGNNILYVYAVAHYTNNGFNMIVLNKDRVENLRLRNAMQKDGIKGAWLTDYPVMARAKAIKQLANVLPLSIDVQQAILSDDMVLKPEMFDKDGLKMSEIDSAVVVPDNIEFTPEDVEKQLSEFATEIGLSETKAMELIGKHGYTNYKEIPENRMSFIMSILQGGTYE